MGYYLRLCKLAVTLTELTKKSQSDKVKLLPKCEVTFTALTKSLCQSPVLSNPDFDKQVYSRQPPLIRDWHSG